MTRHIFRPARGIVAHTYDVFTDDGAHVGTIDHGSHGWRYAPKKSTGGITPTLYAPTLQSLRARMRDAAAQEA